ncbi:amidohydrolase family protein [Aneurinibacillus sp. Ricciae_BoGa-3]|uniref:metal-dependent hydrolase family protein n=1 Tax=Aneurinibacillus sp. Ricciae_BoGa-3 TaxID=3022697 RepID=UPI002340FD6C|nr:amidohydrolase family protein [Aneurinibacillus sp. Ricciae_BoGa-3]WCK53732.1 amidohydrolase family protein [Aneurinibacillus sp. Ricciae_BoGa-3]
MKAKLLRNGLLIDGTGQTEKAGVDVLIEGNRITAIGSGLQVPSQYQPEEIDIIELNGKTIMPGMTEAHTHLTWNNSLYIQDIDFAPIEETMVAAIKNAEIMIKSGYTSCVSAAARGRVDIAIRDAINRGTLIGPRVLANGAEVSATGSFTDLHPSHVQVSGLSILADGEDAVRRTVRSLFKEGADLVKLNVSGESLTPHARNEMTLYTYKEVRAAVEEAHARGKRVYTHARSSDSVKICVEAEVDIIAHADFIDDEAFNMVVQNKDRLFIVPGLNWLVSTIEEAAQYFGQEAIDATGYKEGLEIAIKNMRRLYKAGVRVLPGGDYGFKWCPHGGYARDLEHFVKLIGMDPMDVIVSATKYGSQIMEMEDEIGTIEVGKLADILVVDGNPLEDITILQDHSKLEVIVKDGEYITNLLEVAHQVGDTVA